MKFEWDERKNQLNKTKHGFEFGIVEKFFAADVFERVDDKKDYGETRLLALGELDGEILLVVFTIREAVIYRIISIRKANKNEQQTYRALRKGSEG